MCEIDEAIDSGIIGLANYRESNGNNDQIIGIILLQVLED